MEANESPRVLKAETVRRLGSKVAFNYDDLQKRCAEHIEQVRRQARKILEEAQTEAEAIRQQARKEGYEAGRSQGLQEAESEVQWRAAELSEQSTEQRLQTILPALQKAADALCREKDQWLTEWETMGIRLSRAIAEKILGRELQLRPQQVQTMITQALQTVAGNPEITVRLHPEDAELLGEQKETFIQTASRCGNATLIPDETLDRGDCLIETRHGTVDARLQAQLDRIVSELLPHNGDDPSSR